jgi:hypothetical protein
MNVSHLLPRQHAAAVFGMAGLALCLWPAAVSAQSDQEIRCMQLEQELANDWQGDSGASELPRIQSEIARVEQVYRQNEAQAERQGCYENFFIFGRGLVRTPRCLRMHNQIEDARRQLARLQQQRDAVGSGGGNRRRDRVLEALARNGCGPQYQQQARREPRGFFEELFGGFEPDPIPRRDGWTTSRIDPTMPYRTLCVRECDGYYYPISYSVMPSAFASQRAQCQTQCAAPADLYVYPNPGGQVEQSVSLDGKAYMDHPNAFKYRKDYVKGCSCKVAEYNPAEIEEGGAEKKAEATPAPGSPSPAPARSQAEAPELPPADGAVVTGALPRAQPQAAAPDPQGANVSVAPVRRQNAGAAAPVQAAPVQAQPSSPEVAQQSEAPPRR